MRENGADEPYTLEYTWTQKVSGVWPQSGDRIGDVAKAAQVSVGKLRGRDWAWQSTQYDAETIVRPSRLDRYLVFFGDDGELTVSAPCGYWKGNYSFGARTLDVELNRNWFSGCRDNEAMELFLFDISRLPVAYIEENKLRIALAGSEGIMFFEEDRKKSSTE